MLRGTKRAYSTATFDTSPNKRLKPTTLTPGPRASPNKMPGRILKPGTAIALTRAALRSPIRWRVVKKIKSMKWGSLRQKMIMAGIMLFRVGYRYNRRGKLYLKRYSV